MKMLKGVVCSLSLFSLLVMAGCSSQPKQSEPSDQASQAGESAPAAVPPKSAAPTDAGGSKYGDEPASSARPPKTTPSNEKPDPLAVITCANNAETRTLAIAIKGQACEFHYEKAGNSKILSWSSYNTDHCEKSRQDLKNKLLQAGWKCHQ